MIELRVLTPDDWPVWRELRLAALAEAPAAFGSRLADWQGEGDREERWRERLSIPGSHNLVATLDGRVLAGMATGVPADEPGAVELISMWVSPAARGHGLGNRLLNAVQDWAWRSGAAAIMLAVMPDNENAIALYRRHGFADTDQPGDLTPDGTARELILAKPLTGPAA